MKIDLRVIEHKLNCLLNIYSPNEIYTPKRNKSNYENNNSDNSENNINNENNYDNENKYSPFNLNKNKSIEIKENININNDDEQDINYDNNSVNDQKIEMAIENVVSYNNVQTPALILCGDSFIPIPSSTYFSTKLLTENGCILTLRLDINRASHGFPSNFIFLSLSQFFNIFSSDSVNS